MRFTSVASPSLRIPPTIMSTILAASNSIGEGWPADLVRRLHVLLHALSLDSLRRSDAMRDAEFRHYDSPALALRVLDTGRFDEAVHDVLEPVLRMPINCVDELLDRGFPLFVGLRVPVLAPLTGDETSFLALRGVFDSVTGDHGTTASLKSK